MTDKNLPSRSIDIVVATANPGKLGEMRALLGAGYHVMSAAECGAVLPDETETTFSGNASLKAVAIAQQTGKISVADDSGLVVDALAGAPGVYSARYSGPQATDASNRAKLLRELTAVPADQRDARFVSAIAIAFTPDDVEIAEGMCEGRITMEERGSGGFGYDSLFELPSGRTMAEITAEEKNAVSHRGRAMALARAILEKRLGVNEAAMIEGDPK